MATQNRLSIRTHQAEQAQLAKRESRADAQVRDFYETMGACADRGQHSGYYNKDLSKDAVERLRKEGVTLRDDGEGIASSWFASWE